MQRFEENIFPAMAMNDKNKLICDLQFIFSGYHQSVTSLTFEVQPLITFFNVVCSLRSLAAPLRFWQFEFPALE